MKPNPLKHTRWVYVRGMAALVCLVILVRNNFRSEKPVDSNSRHEKAPLNFLPPESLNKFDHYAAAWWQSIPRFLEVQTEHIRSLEDATFKAIWDAGNSTLDVRMTKNWIAFAVEHFSAYNRGLADDAARAVLHGRLEEYTLETTKRTDALQSTLAVLPYRGCDRDFRLELRVGGGFCQIALEATIASLVRQGIGRVVVVTVEESDRVTVDLILNKFRRRFPTSSEFVCILTEVIYNGKVAHVPKTALMGLSEALQFQNATWLGSGNNFRYVYFTEPDQLLVGSLDYSHEVMDAGGILVPHRLEAIQHWSDFEGIDTQTVTIPRSVQSPVHNLSLSNQKSDRCCDAGRIPVRRCSGQHKWFVCPFPPNDRGFEIFDKHEFLRIADGSGLTLLTTQGVDRKPSYCRPKDMEC